MYTYLKKKGMIHRCGLQYLFYNETETGKFSLSGILMHFFICKQCVCLMKLYILGCHSQQVLVEKSSNFVLIHEFESTWTKKIQVWGFKT